MVTGIEVTGIALAVFPLVVNGLSHFAEGVATIKSWRRYRRELANYARMLEGQHISYLNTIEKLLDDIVQSDDELASLVKQPGGEVWKRPEYDVKLKERLDHSYNPYMAIMSSMVEALESIQEVLGVSSSGEVHWDNFSVLEREIKRIKIVLSKNIYKDLIAQIDGANNQLRKITKQEIDLEPVRAKRQSQRSDLDFRIVRRRAESLYNVIVAGSSWRCQCRDSHVANLRLEPRPPECTSINLAGKPKLKFRVLLSTSKSQAKPEILRTWQEVEVEPVEDVLTQQHTLKHGTEQDVRNNCSSDHPKSFLVRLKKTLKFATVNSQNSTSFSSAVLPFTNEGGIDRIVDFCTTLKQVRGVPKAIGYLLDEGFEHHRHDICLIKDNYVSVGSKTLDSLLQLSHKRVSGFYLNQKDRLHLAVVLASSVLQLDGTSWLKKQWRSCDIFFLQTENPLPNVPRIDYAYPYLSTKISSDALRPSSNTEGSTAYTAHLIRCEVLFALGLTLIELSFGETLVGKQIPDDVDNSEIVTSYRTANRLLDYVYNESGSRYGDVVRRCIQCPFDVRHPNLDNEEFQQAVFEYIVTPLVQDLEDFNGGSRIR